MRDSQLAFERYVIKSFKHDGSVHRVWLENWLVPESILQPHHRSESMWVYLNEHTTIIERDGKEWVSRVPAVSFFATNRWYNVVALLEERGIRYYCNLASPPYRYGNVLTYIDYDLDVVVMPGGEVQELDRDEFIRHRNEYRYSEEVQDQVERALLQLREEIDRKSGPFGDAAVRYYYEQWKKQTIAGGGGSSL